MPDELEPEPVAPVEPEPEVEPVAEPEPDVVVSVDVLGDVVLGDVVLGDEVDGDDDVGGDADGVRSPGRSPARPAPVPESVHPAARVATSARAEKPAIARFMYTYLLWSWNPR